MVGSKDTELATLIVTNSQLTATNASLTGQLLEMVGLQERVGTLQDENARLLDEVGGLRQQNADLSSAKWAMEQEVRLAGAQRSAKRQRKVVMLGAMGTAWLGCTIGIVLLVLNILDIIPGPLGPYFFIMGTFPTFALLTLQPNDEKRIRMRAALWCGTVAGFGVNPVGVACGFFIAFGLHPTTFCPFEGSLCTFCGVGGALVMPLVVPLMFIVLGPMLKRKPEAIAARPFKASLREARQAAIAKAGPVAGSIAFALFPANFWCMNEMEHRSFAMSSRACLERLWIMPRVFGAGVMVTVTAVSTIATFLIHPQQPEGSNLTATIDGVEYVYMSEDAFWQILSLLIAFVLQIPLSLVWTQKNRARISTFLNSIAVRGEAGRAAAVAAIIGDSDPQKVLALARRSFRGLPLALLRRSDLEVSADTGLNAKTQRCRLGEVDAFVSHSWSDDPAAKWRVLQAWGAAFEERTGGGAIIWLDKACIDQTKIDDNLACLPVHLAGCKSLLVLAGPTYTKRLWCILEVFTWLKAGGGFDALELVPIAADADDGGEGGGGGRLGFEAVRAAFLKFSVEEARCYKEDERQHLLGVVETGFGSLDTFDELVRSLFAESLEKGASFKLEPGQAPELPPSPPPGPPGKLEC